MPLSIPLTGLAANDVVPGTYVETLFAQGAASLGNTTYAVVLIGNKSTAGDATVDTAIYGPWSSSPAQLGSVQDAINRFGQGSELHRMYKRFLAVNPNTPIFAIAVAESAGAAAAQAVTFTGTATANGSVRTYVGDDFVDTAVTLGDTPTIIAANVVVQVNSKLDWAVTAAAAAGVLTLTAKNKGPRGNWLRGNCSIVGSSVGVTSSVPAVAFFTGGTTADSNTNALATIAPYRYYYLVSAAEDATQVGAVASLVNANALPTTGVRERFVAGSIDTAGNLTTIATATNNARGEFPWLQNADWTPAELASNCAAIYSLGEIPTAFRCNFDSYGQDAVTAQTWKVPAPRSGTAPTRATIKAALNNGITPIGVSANGTTYLVKRVTSKSLTGANNDYRIRDAHKVTVCDRFADDWIAKSNAQFSGKNISDDPPVGGRPLASNVVSPRIIKAALQKLVVDYGDLGLLQNVAAINAGIVVIREAGAATRVSTSVPLQTIDILDQVTTALSQVA